MVPRSRLQALRSYSSCGSVECRDRVQVGRASSPLHAEKAASTGVVFLPAISATHRLLFPAFLIAHLCVLCALWITIIGCSQLTPILAEVYGIAIYGIASSRSRIKKRQRRIDDSGPAGRSCPARIRDWPVDRVAFSRRDSI